MDEFNDWVNDTFDIQAALPSLHHFSHYKANRKLPGLFKLVSLW